jgi:hypothetical protein
MTALITRLTGILVILGTHSRYPYDKRDEAYTHSYRIIRLVVGSLGIALPILFIIEEAAFLKGGVHVRGSLSAYYHSPTQDFFVGGLCIIGLMLATYMSGEPGSWDFWVSLLAGIAVLGVVFFPTSRPPDLAKSGICGSPHATSCSVIESTLGEHQTAVIHTICAIVFIICLAIMSFLFAISEVLPDNNPSAAPGQRKKRIFRKPILFGVHSGLALVILAAGAWAFWGAQLGQLTPLYIGEVASVWAFGVSWLLAGLYMTAPARFSQILGWVAPPRPGDRCMLFVTGLPNKPEKHTFLVKVANTDPVKGDVSDAKPSGREISFTLDSKASGTVAVTLIVDGIASEPVDLDVS